MPAHVVERVEYAFLVTTENQVFARNLNDLVAAGLIKLRLTSDAKPFVGKNRMLFLTKKLCVEIAKLWKSGCKRLCIDRKNESKVYVLNC